jgi:hypothetical protein
MRTTLKYYKFVIKLHGAVGANSEQEATDKINAHLDDLGDVESIIKYDLGWPETSWELEEA